MSNEPIRTPLPQGAVSGILAIMDNYARAHAAAVSADKDEEIAQLRQYLDAAQRRGEGLREQVVALQNQVIRLTKILDDAGIDA